MAARQSIFSSGIDELEQSIANVSFGDVDETTKDDIIRSTYSAIGSLETITNNDERSSERMAVSLETPPPTPPPYPKSKGSPSLPTELLIHIMSFVPKRSQKTFASACKVSRQWYYAAIAHLWDPWPRYANPQITTGNYEKFVATICPSVTNIKPSPLSGLVKCLDLGGLAYDGKASYTARLLRRTQKSLEVFVAPQTQFGCSCLVALSHCVNLRSLDLRLVTQALGLSDLFQHIKGLPNLRRLNFPRSMMIESTSGVKTDTEFTLPPKLVSFSITGGVSDTCLMKLDAPPTLTELRISHLSFARNASIRNLLLRLSPQLTILEVNFHIAMLPHNALDKILVMCPNLVELCVAVDFITPHIFDEENTPPNHPLQRLDLDCSGVPGAELKLKPDDIYICLAEGRLPAVRIIRISERLNWMVKERADVEDLVGLLEYRSVRQQEETGQAEPGLAGVWEFS